MRVLLPLSGIDLLRYYSLLHGRSSWTQLTWHSSAGFCASNMIDPSFPLPTGVVLGTCFQ